MKRVEPRVSHVPPAFPRRLQTHHLKARLLLGVIPLLWIMCLPLTLISASQGPALELVGVLALTKELQILPATAYGPARVGLQIGLVIWTLAARGGIETSTVARTTRQSLYRQRYVALFVVSRVGRFLTTKLWTARY